MTLSYLKNTPRLLLLCIGLWITSAVYANNLIFTPIDASQGLSDNQIRYILQLPDGRMVFTTSGSVNLYNGVHFNYLHRSAKDLYPLAQYDGHYRIYQSGDSLLWIKDTHKLMCINLRQEQYMADLDSYFRNKKIEETVEDLFVDPVGRTWLLTSKGLQELETGNIIPLPTGQQSKLQDLNAEDNHLFLFYHTGEVVCYDINRQKQLYSRAAYPASEQKTFQKTSLVIKGENGFYQLRNGEKGALFFFNSRHRTWKKLFEQNYTLNTLIITPHSEKAYISCIHGFWTINLTNGVQQYTPVLETKKGQLVSTEISTIFQDRQGGLWLGTFNRGLLYYHPSMYKLTYINRNSFPIQPAEDLVIKAFAEDSDGRIYLKTHSNIYQLDIQKKDSPDVIPVPASSLTAELLSRLNAKGKHSFKDKWYTAVCTDSRGWTWAGTADGLELFTHKDASPRTFYRENGLSNNFVQAVMEDRQKNIWITTSNGISRIHVNPQNHDISFTNFNQQDGALDGEYANGAAFQSSDGTLYFGGIDGFNLFLPTKEPVSPGLPDPPILTSLYVHNEKVAIGKAYDHRMILPQAPPYITEIELNHNQNFLTFEFCALNYANSARTYYRYQMEGIDREWIETSTDTDQQGITAKSNGSLQASYTNLPPGEYTLRVAASDNIFQWNHSMTEVKLIIHAPWWKTTTAYIIYIIALLLITIASIQLYIYWTRKKMERAHKEEILLLRIRNLIDQCNNYEAEKANSTEKKLSSVCHADDEDDEEENEDEEVIPMNNHLNPTESAFLSQAIELVEKNLQVAGYSVEQLSRDLCMERTGLYRKLVTLLDQSPSLFIRNIRLQRAAQLLIEDTLSVTEIAERTGFSSSSYLSKCFQEMYGCRPSEYTEKMKKST